MEGYISKVEALFPKPIYTFDSWLMISKDEMCE